MKPYYKPLCSNLLLLFFTLLSFSIHAQVDPTLAVGLEKLTMNKGVIDVEALTEIIMEKQKELKKEALKRFMFKLFPDDSYATKYYLQNALHILMNEKNPHVIEKEILELTTNYALALGIATIYYNYNESSAELRAKNVVFDTDTKLYLSDIGQESLNYMKMLDIVSLSLSNSKKIKDKGFYKNPINYRSENKFKTPPNDDKIKLLEKKITDRIDAYTEHFEIIKEFYSKVGEGKNIKEISDELIKIYINDIANINLNQAAINIDNGSLSNTGIILLAKNFQEDLNKYNRSMNSGDLQIMIELITNFQESKAKLDITKKQLKQTDSLLLKEIVEIPINYQASYILKKPNDTLTGTILDDKKIEIEALIVSHHNDKFIVDSQEKHVGDMLSTIKRDLIILKKNWQINFNVPDFTNNKEVISLKKELSSNIQTKDQIASAHDNLVTKFTTLSQEKDYLEMYLKKIKDKFLDPKAYSLQLDLKSEEQLKLVKEYTALLQNYYTTLSELSKKETIKLADVKYVEEKIIPTLINFSIISSNHTADKGIKTTVDDFKILANLLKVKIVSGIKQESNLSYDKQLNDILVFVSNLDKLDEAETYQIIINMIRDNSQLITNYLRDKTAKLLDKEKVEKEKNFIKSYTLFINAVKKYTIINTSENYLNIDVISFLNDLQQYYNRNEKSWFSLYMTLGLSENFFFNEIELGDSTKRISNIGFASEKIGLKARVRKFDHMYGIDNAIDDIYINKRNPFVNEWYVILYGSGLLYSLANTSTKENFDYPHIAFGTGLRFYNALDLNLSLGVPFIDGRPLNFKNSFFSIGLDVPLAEYLEKIGKK